MSFPSVDPILVDIIKEEMTMRSPSVDNLSNGLTVIQIAKRAARGEFVTVGDPFYRDVYTTIHFLEREGTVYSTIDKRHYKWSDADADIITDNRPV
jgi:hypothetical protein